MGPSGPVTVAVLLCLFAGAAIWLTRTRRLPLQLLAGLLAFSAAAAAGVSGVNAYYDYYRSWGDLFADVAADNGPPAQPVTLPMPITREPSPNASPSASPATRPAPDAAPWRLIRVAFPGPVSGVQGRTALVVLPPHAAGPLPVLELLHGEPGGPDSWIGGLQLAAVLQREAAAGRISPLLVVLPDVRGFHDQQCLDPVFGRHLSTYLQQDVPADISRLLPAEPAGPHWVVGGLSEGGYCAADLVLHQPGSYAGAAVLDGYFHPSLSPSLVRRIFAGDPRRVAADDPTSILSSWPPDRSLPRFWLMAGTANATDYDRAVSFGRLAAAREPVRFLTVLGGRHTTPAWRVALPDLLHWASAVVNGHAFAGSTSVPLQ
jgi:hypothetical protein